LRTFGLAVMDALYRTPESPAVFVWVGRLADRLVAAVAPDRGRFRALRVGFEVHSRAPALRALRVALLVAGMARQRALPDEVARGLVLAGLCLDLGHTLLPRGASAEVRRRHPHLSVDLLAGHGGLGPLARAAIQGHHERLDGTGSPLGLVGDAVPWPARLLALCTAWVTATTPPPTGPACPAYAASASLAGPGFDARLRTELEALIARRDDRWSLLP
jgi:HD-GYP domain-containing protein (c-di-GMP phosphodiesterase class II)